MKKWILISYFFLNGFLWASSPLMLTDPNIQTEQDFKFKIDTLSDEMWQDMVGSTWFAGCPVGREELSYLQLSYWGFDQNVHQGSLIVKKTLAGDTVDIFSELFDTRFPIQSMELIDHYHGAAREALAAINTIAFNCRSQIGSTKFSKHSYGVAIDINPTLNPYVSHTKVIPNAAGNNINRYPVKIGMISHNTPIYKSFTDRSWRWGGDWNHPKDYMHFEAKID